MGQPKRIHKIKKHPPKYPGWLTGWKAICAYIGRCQDTAETYAREYGMPILRDPGGAILALPSEIDRWIREFNRLSDNKTHTER